MQLYFLDSDGLSVPVRYYLHPQHKTQVALIGMLHVGEKNFYLQIDKILQDCEVVIYEEPFIRDSATMEQLDKAWRDKLEEKGNLNESFLAAIFLPMPPQKFMNDQSLVQETHHFDYTQKHWISGDGTWDGNAKENAALSEDVWTQIRDAIKTLPTTIKREKVKAAKKFLKNVDAGKASMQEYISFRNLHEEEIEEKIHKRTLVDPRDKLTFEIFDNIIETRAPLSIGIKYGNGHLPGMDAELQARDYRYIATMWLRILTIK